MKKLAAYVFPGFQTLDFFGPIEMLGGLRDDIEITLVAENLDPVPNVNGHKILPEKTFADSHDYDLLFIPGGDSALVVAKNKAVSDWLIKTSANAELVMTVCTGSVLLATTGVLDGHRATTNKQDFIQTIPLGPKVDWVKKARWVEDGSYVRMKNISLGYQVPKFHLRRLGLASARIYVSGQNLLTLTGYRGYDPEVNYNSGGDTNSNRNLGLDYGSYPNAKSYTVGLQVTF